MLLPEVSILYEEEPSLKIKKELVVKLNDKIIAQAVDRSRVETGRMFSFSIIFVFYNEVE